jgi:hypothetical protein
VLGFFLLVFFASLLLSNGISNILSETLREAKKGARDDKNSGAGQSDKTG